MRFEYLPPYSPDYNPIEFTFSVIKAALKGKHQPNGNETPKELTMHVMQTAMKVVMRDIAESQFRFCQIHVD